MERERERERCGRVVEGVAGESVCVQRKGRRAGAHMAWPRVRLSGRVRARDNVVTGSTNSKRL